MEALSFDNILGEQDIESLFESPEETPATEDAGGSGEKKPDKIENNETTTTEVVPEELFMSDEQEEQKEEPESVGSGKKEDKKEKEGTSADEDDGTSPNDENFYSSIANALAVDGAFPNLDEETVKKANSAEAFSELFDKEVEARLDEVQQRVANALKNGVEASDIRKYESTIDYLSRVTEQQLIEESEKGEELRRRLIFQDYLNKGMSPEKAQKLVDRSVDAGNDIEDAKDALMNNREFFQGQYDSMLKEAQEAADKEKAEKQKMADSLKKSLLEDKQLMGDMEIGKDVRKKALEAISKPVYRDPETGAYMTAIQKYESENHADFIKYIGLFYSLTNGFKDFKSFTKAEVKKEVKKGLRELEQTLNNTKRSSDGGLKMVTTVAEDPESYLGSGFTFDL